MSNPPHFSAVLSPSRSLTKNGFVLLMMFVSIVSLITAMVFLLMGAWPVSGFFGLDVIGLYVALKLNMRALKRMEIIEVFERELRITQVPSAGRAKSFSFNPYWVQLDLAPRADGRKELSVSSHGRRLIFGTFLTPEEKVSFAERLTQVLARHKHHSSVQFTEN